MRITVPNAIESKDPDNFQPDTSSDLYTLTPVLHLEIGASRSGSKVHTLTVSENEVLEVTLDDGSRWFLGPEERNELIENQTDSLRGVSDGSLILDDSVFSARDSRGFLSDAIKRIRVLLQDTPEDLGGDALDLAREQFGKHPINELRSRIIDPIAYTIARRLEKKMSTNGITRLCQLNQVGGAVSLQPLTDQEVVALLNKTPERPALLMLHGTLSSTQGSFGDLWASRLQDFQRLVKFYGERILALEHCTLTESPLSNALLVANSLPEKANLHLLSHSRGGLVGELLCRGTRVEENAFSTEDLDMFKAQQNRHIDESGLSADAAQALQQHFKNESEKLHQLDDALNSRQIVIERFVRVGCPARGTTLASGKLHRWSNRAFNAVGLLGGQKLNPVYRMFEQFTLGVLQSNSKPDVLPGLQAQMPGSALIHVLNNSQASIPADLSIVSGDLDITRRLDWKRIPVWASDRFFGGANDLVVNTASMDGGANRDAGIHALKVMGDHVNHFSYFGNADSARQLVNRLIDGTSTRFELIQRPEEVHIPRSSRPVHTGDRAVLLLVPGLLGSELKLDGKTLWLNLPSLVKGRITQLSVEGSSAKVAVSDVLDRTYGEFIGHFSKTHDVHVCPYDWRESLSECASTLAIKLEAILESQDQSSTVQPVRIVAHSMGGLVVRTLMAERADLWDRVRSRKGSRFVMAGTPTNGSYSINRMLSGELQLIKLLALADLKNNQQQIMNMIARFPGVATLLPGFGTLEWLQDDTWTQLSDSPGADAWSLIDQQLLVTARRERQRMLETQLDPNMVSYVAGCSESTPVDAEFDLQHGGSLQFRYTPEGDGQVSWDEGIPQGLTSVWFQPSVHGSLLADQRWFKAWEELLETGQTRSLSRQRPAQGGRSAQALNSSLPAAADVIDYLPDSRTLAGIAMGMSLEHGRDEQQISADQLRVTIAHADLSFSSFPVAVGHYQGDSILHAEKILDKELDHRLSERQSTGQYPGPIGTSEVIFKRSGREIPEGALVIGLGQLGELSTARLERTLTNAMVKYIFECNDWWSTRNHRDEVQALGLSVLLIGSGLGSMSVHDSVGALIKAASKANEVFRQKQIDAFRLLGHLEIVELYQDLALQAAQAANTWAPHVTGVEVDTQVITHQGGRRRSRFTSSSDWWHTISVKVSDNDDEYIYDDFTRFARNELSREPVNRVFVDHFIEQIMHSTQYDASDEASCQEALFQLLFPQTLKESTPDSDKLLLSLDEETARLPWEMLVDGWSADRLPLAISKKMIRRLSMDSTMLRPEPSRRNAALVVGDPPSGSDGYPMLRGAREEAHEVERQLRINNRFEVTSCISNEETDRAGATIAMDIVRNLYSQEYRILHLAGHGSYYRSTSETLKNHKDEGMVLGEGLRLTPALVRKLPRAPAVVFLNCCHLGYVERRDAQPRVRYNHIAANLATQFIMLGAQVVIAAGWEVNDGAAKRFAEVFYDNLLLNKPLSHCIHEARMTIYKQFPNHNTFGAYQCWGDPEFRLDPRGESSSQHYDASSFMSEHECELEADNIGKAALTARENERQSLINDANGLLRHVVSQYEDPWKTPAARQSQWSIERTRVLAMLGRAYGELGNLTVAIGLLRVANALNPSALSASDLERLGNFEVRQAIHPAGESTSIDFVEIPATGSSWTMLQAGKKRLGQLLTQYGESGAGGNLRQIHCLMGSAVKREALYVAANSEPVSRILSSLQKQQYHYGIGWTGETEGVTLEQPVEDYIRQAALNQQSPVQYGFVNFALAYLLNRWSEPQPAAPLPETFVELVALFTRTVQQSIHRHDSYWTAIMEADVMMLQLLEPELRERVQLYDTDTNLPEAIKQIYCTADKRFGSTRQWSSAFDHLTFMEAMIANRSLFSKAGNKKAVAMTSYNDLLAEKARGSQFDEQKLLLLVVGDIKQCVAQLRDS